MVNINTDYQHKLHYFDYQIINDEYQHKSHQNFHCSELP